MYVRGKRLQKGSVPSSSALQQRRTDGRRHTRETTETGACDYPGTPQGSGRVGVTKKAKSGGFHKTLVTPNYDLGGPIPRTLGMCAPHFFISRAQEIDDFTSSWLDSCVFAHRDFFNFHKLNKLTEIYWRR